MEVFIKVKSYIKYLKQLNKSHISMFGENNALFNANTTSNETSFLNDSGWNNPYQK